MHPNLLNKMRTRLDNKLKHKQLVKNSLAESRQVKGCRQTESEKEDQPNQQNLYIKQEPKIIGRNLVTCKDKLFSTKSEECVYLKIRSSVFRIYSKLQFTFQLSMQSLFLAIDIFDKYIDKNVEKNKSVKDILLEYQTLSLACLMIAAKYEQIYPPNLQKLKGKLNVNLNNRNYVQTQINVLKQLNFNVHMDSPIKYLSIFPQQLNEQKKYFIYLYLEIAACNTEIKKLYSWQQIMQAILVLFFPINQNLEENVSQKIRACLKKLIIERTRLEQSNFGIYKKYSLAKCYCVSLKPFYIVQEL